MSSYPKNNPTYQIIHAAREGNYAVGGFCVYVVSTLSCSRIQIVRLLLQHLAPVVPGFD